MPSSENQIRELNGEPHIYLVLNNWYTMVRLGYTMATCLLLATSSHYHFSYSCVPSEDFSIVLIN